MSSSITMNTKTILTENKKKNVEYLYINLYLKEWINKLNKYII